MAIRAKLLQGATAFLYIGPLLAGLAGYGWAMLPPFVSIFALWLLMLRPHQWPQTGAEWLRPQALLGVLTLILTQILLIATLFGIGRGIGGVAGHLPMVHPFLPLTVSFMALPLSRLVWKAETALARGVTLDEILHPHGSPDATPSPSASAGARPRARAEDEIRPLLALPDTAPLTEIGPALDDVLDESDAWHRLQVLVEALDAAPGRHAALREALVIWATEPEHFAANTAPTGLRAAFRAAGRDPAILRMLLPRAAALARIMPERHGQFPDRAEIESLAAKGLPGQLAADHAALMGALGHRPVRTNVRPRSAIGQAQPT
jgi:hypothetical protein